MGNSFNDKLYLHFINEEYFLEHWTIQATLNKEDNTSLYGQMNKRLVFVREQIAKIPDSEIINLSQKLKG